MQRAKITSSVKITFMFFILQLAFPYQLQGRHDLGRPKQRWKDQENLQDKPKPSLLLLLLFFALLILLL